MQSKLDAILATLKLVTELVGNMTTDPHHFERLLDAIGSLEEASATPVRPAEQRECWFLWKPEPGTCEWRRGFLMAWSVNTIHYEIGLEACAIVEEHGGIVRVIRADRIVFGQDKPSHW